MCGICGISWKDERLAKKMVARISYRGPDDEGVLVHGKATLGHARLAIIDLSKKGRQPMTYDKARYAITFNGEIYNYKEVQAALKKKNYRFTSTSDTEVILAAYQEWGPKCLDKFNGMFAFCIHDKKTGTLFLARDRFGIKPLYYAHDTNKKKLSFSSEINGLRNLTIQPTINHLGLRQFFTFRFTLGDTTLLEGVRKLLPGHYLVYDPKKNTIVTKKYYTLAPTKIKDKKSYAWYKRELKRRLAKAVERRMVADVPVSAFLSGGIDSTTITKHAKEHNEQLNTFSMGFETTNELAYARLAARAFRTNHHELVLTQKDLKEHLDGMVEHLDEPVGDPGYLPIFILSRAVSKHNKVVLSGDGGDEVLAGYDRYKLLHYGWTLRHFSPGMGSDILTRLQAMKGKDEYEAFIEIIRLFDDKELKRLGITPYDARAWWPDWPRSRVERAQVFDIATLLPGDFFMKADKMSSAWGLEQRVPFLDHELVEFAFAIPLRHKLRLWKEKRILKDAYKEDLPKQIVKRRKHGFNVPIDHWFKESLGLELKKLLQASTHGLYEKDYVFHLLDKIKEKGTNYKENFVLAQKLWSILIFERWLEQVQQRQ